MTDTSAIILGASGSVGQALLGEAVRSARFSRIVVISRRPTNLTEQFGDSVLERVVPDMQPARLREEVVGSLKSCDHEVFGFSVLGIGAGTAKLSIDQHRAVDVELNAAFAAGLKDSGKVRHLAFMSAIGADPKASTTGSGAAGMPRYARVKGESEQAVIREGPAVVSLFPSLGDHRLPAHPEGACAHPAPAVAGVAKEVPTHLRRGHRPRHAGGLPGSAPAHRGLYLCRDEGCGGRGGNMSRSDTARTCGGRSTAL